MIGVPREVPPTPTYQQPQQEESISFQPQEENLRFQEQEKPPPPPTEIDQTKTEPTEDLRAVSGPHTAADAAFTRTGRGSSHLPPSQSPTITLLQKAREGQIPKGASYIEDKHDSRGSGGDLKYEGIGPTECGIPVGLRTGVKEEYASDWYKTMYKSLHRTRDNAQGQTVHLGGYMSEPEFDRKDDLRLKYSTVDYRRKPAKKSPREVEPRMSQLPEERLEPVVYHHQPRSIADYEPGHSSLADQEFQKHEHFRHSPRHEQTSGGKWPSAFLSDGYESDSTLIRKRPTARVDPEQQKVWYKEIQKGGEIPFSGLRKAAPEKPKAFLSHDSSTTANIGHLPLPGATPPCYSHKHIPLKTCMRESNGKRDAPHTFRATPMTTFWRPAPPARHSSLWRYPLQDPGPHLATKVQLSTDHIAYHSSPTNNASRFINHYPSRSMDFLQQHSFFKNDFHRRKIDDNKNYSSSKNYRECKNDFIVKNDEVLENYCSIDDAARWNDLFSPYGNRAQNDSSTDPSFCEELSSFRKKRIPENFPSEKINSMPSNTSTFPTYKSAVTCGNVMKFTTSTDFNNLAEPSVKKNVQTFEKNINHNHMAHDSKTNISSSKNLPVPEFGLFNSQTDFETPSKIHISSHCEEMTNSSTESMSHRKKWENTRNLIQISEANYAPCSDKNNNLESEATSVHSNKICNLKRTIKTAINNVGNFEFKIANESEESEAKMTSVANKNENIEMESLIPANEIQNFKTECPLESKQTGILEMNIPAANDKIENSDVELSLLTGKICKVSRCALSNDEIGNSEIPVASLAFDIISDNTGVLSTDKGNGQWQRGSERSCVEMTDNPDKIKPYSRMGVIKGRTISKEIQSPKESKIQIESHINKVSPIPYNMFCQKDNIELKQQIASSEQQDIRKYFWVAEASSFVKHSPWMSTSKSKSLALQLNGKMLERLSSRCVNEDKCNYRNSKRASYQNVVDIKKYLSPGVHSKRNFGDNSYYRIWNSTAEYSSFIGHEKNPSTNTKYYESNICENGNNIFENTKILTKSALHESKEPCIYHHYIATVFHSISRSQNFLKLKKYYSKLATSPGVKSSETCNEVQEPFWRDARKIPRWRKEEDISLRIKHSSVEDLRQYFQSSSSENSRNSLKHYRGIHVTVQYRRLWYNISVSSLVEKYNKINFLNHSRHVAAQWRKTEETQMSMSTVWKKVRVSHWTSETNPNDIQTLKTSVYETMKASENISASPVVAKIKLNSMDHKSKELFGENKCTIKLRNTESALFKKANSFEEISYPTCTQKMDSANQTSCVDFRMQPMSSCHSHVYSADGKKTFQQTKENEFYLNHDTSGGNKLATFKGTDKTNVSFKTGIYRGQDVHSKIKYFEHKLSRQQNENNITKAFLEVHTFRRKSSFSQRNRNLEPNSSSSLCHTSKQKPYRSQAIGLPQIASALSKTTLSTQNTQRIGFGIHTDRGNCGMSRRNFSFGDLSDVERITESSHLGRSLNYFLPNYIPERTVSFTDLRDISHHQTPCCLGSSLELREKDFPPTPWLSPSYLNNDEEAWRKSTIWDKTDFDTHRYYLTHIKTGGVAHTRNKFESLESLGQSSPSSSSLYRTQSLPKHVPCSASRNVGTARRTTYGVEWNKSRRATVESSGTVHKIRQKLEDSVSNSTSENTNFGHNIKKKFVETCRNPYFPNRSCVSSLQEQNYDKSPQSEISRDFKPLHIGVGGSIVMSNLSQSSPELSVESCSRNHSPSAADISFSKLMVSDSGRRSRHQQTSVSNRIRNLIIRFEKQRSLQRLMAKFDTLKQTAQPAKKANTNNRINETKSSVSIKNMENQFSISTASQPLVTTGVYSRCRTDSRPSSRVSFANSSSGISSKKRFSPLGFTTDQSSGRSSATSCGFGAASPHQYQETEVNIHYRSPIRNLEKEYIEEEELRKRQEDAMRRFYEDERCKKHLQQMAEAEMRRHSDFFTPSQKSPIALNRYDNPFDSGFQMGGTPEPRTLVKALYPFTAQTTRELSLNKGDIVYINKQVDKNWYEGEHHGLVGIFPVSYVEVIPTEKANLQPKKASEGHATVHYNFRAQTPLELSLFKGENVILVRRVDLNWYEGRIGAKKGIFPASYINVIQEPGDFFHGDRAISPKPPVSPIYNGSIMIQGPTFNTGISPLPPKAEPKSPITQSLHIDTYHEPIPYRCLYAYVPQNEDELELREADTVYVMEKCDDGWYVGTSLRSGLFGTFPGNYVERI